MNSKLLLTKILTHFKDQGKAQAPGLNTFVYVRETNSSVVVLRENGNEDSVPFSKIITGIEAFQGTPSLYHEGPSSLREFGITHVNSPIYAMLHLLEKEEYQK